MSLPLPNLRDLKCAIIASTTSTIGAAVGVAAVVSVASIFFPELAPIIPILKATLGGAGVTLPISTADSYISCKMISNEAYDRDVKTLQHIAYCKTLEEGKIVVAKLWVYGDVTMSKAAEWNQLPEKYYLDYEECVKNGYIVREPKLLPAPVTAPPVPPVPNQKEP